MILIGFLLYVENRDEEGALELTVEHPVVPRVGESVSFSAGPVKQVDCMVEYVNHCVNSAPCRVIVYVKVYGSGVEYIGDLPAIHDR